MSGAGDAASRLQGLQRENGRLQEQLRSSEELNASLRSELDLHCSIMAQTGSHHLEHSRSHDQEGSGLRAEAHKQDRDTVPQQKAAEQSHTVNSGRKLVRMTMFAASDVVQGLHISILCQTQGNRTTTPVYCIIHSFIY